MVDYIDPAVPIVKQNGTMEYVFQLFVKEISDNFIVIGSGNPEGVLEAGQGKLYLDADGSPGSVLYIKQKNDISGDRKSGWTVV